MSKAILEIDMPNSCSACKFLDDTGDYPKCIVTNEVRGYNFKTFENKMDKCPLKISVKEEKNNNMLFIDLAEFQTKILNYICSKEVNKIFNCTDFANNPESQTCKQAMIYGMATAAIIASQCELYSIEKKINETKEK